MGISEARTYTGTQDLHAFIETQAEPEWMLSLRRRALEEFKGMEWPTTSDEEWRRSDISNYDFDNYSYATAPDAVEKRLPGEGIGGLLDFVDGRCVRRGLRPEIESRGIAFESLRSFLEKEAVNHDGSVQQISRRLEGLLDRAIDRSDNRVTSWHYASWSHGILLYVPKGVRIAEPFVVDFLEQGDGSYSAPLVTVIIEEDAEASLIQRVHGKADGEVLLNAGMALTVGDNAAFRVATVNTLNIDSSVFSHGFGWIGRDAHVHHGSHLFGGMFTKARFDGILDGAGSDVMLDGLYFPHEDQHIDLRTVQVHNGPHANSRTFYKGAVRDEAHSIYQGMIQVAHEAVGTDAYLTNNNLLLNDGARADSIPGLQISTDDVKCSHGSTTGRLEKDQLFYLESRGYPRQEAETMLIQGFFEEVVARAPEGIRDEIREIVAARALEEYEE